MPISIRLSADDEILIKEYARLNCMSISECIRNAVLEKIENELDLKAFNEAKAEFEKNPVRYSHEQIMGMLNN